MNVVFDLGGVLVEWNPDAIVAAAFDDPGLRAIAKREIVMHPDWLELDRGALSFAEAIERAALRSGIEYETVERFIQDIPASLTAKRETVELLYRVREAGNAVYALSGHGVHRRRAGESARGGDIWYQDDTISGCGAGGA